MGKPSVDSVASGVQTSWLLIGERLPLLELGIEAQRERAASSALPPLHSAGR